MMNRTELNRWIGSRIYKERVARKISQETLAEAAGLSRVFVSMLENGNGAAKIDTYYRITCALGISLCELFRENDFIETADDILSLLSDCSSKEIYALAEILRVIKLHLCYSDTNLR